jgi:hypothetical protein
MVLHVLGEVHQRHPALGELAEDPVAVGERGGRREDGGFENPEGEVPTPEP